MTSVFSSRGRWVREFLEADTRRLAVFRIAFGALLLGHTLTVPRGHRLVAYFTELGVTPTWLLAAQSPLHHETTFFRLVHDERQALLAFGVVAAIDLLFLLGILTRITGPLAVAGAIAIHHRVPHVVNGSMVMIHLLGMWSVLLPLGRHLSIDALIARRRGIEWGPLRVRSLAVLGFRLQLFVVYFFNVVHKTGSTWRDGTAVHYVLQQQRAALPTAVFVREHAPSWFSPVATYGTLAVEAAIALLVVSPFAPSRCRRAAAVAMIALHGSFALLLNLGPFPFVFACAAILLLVGEDGDRLPAVLGGGVPAGVEVGPRNEGASQGFVSRLAFPAREAAFVGLMVVFLHSVWAGNRAMRFAFGDPPAFEAASYVRDVLYVPQAWHLFAADAPTSDTVLMPVVVLHDGRHVDVRRHTGPDFALADGRLLETNYFDQTYDARLLADRNGEALRAFSDYVARVPSLERWPGERRVDEVLLHVLTTHRAAPHDVRPPVLFSDVAYTRRYPNGARPPRRDPSIQGP